MATTKPSSLAAERRSNMQTKTKPKTQPQAIKSYLIAYNAITLLAWSYTLFCVVEFILTPRATLAGAAGSAIKGDKGTAKGQLMGLFSAASEKIHLLQKNPVKAVPGSISSLPDFIPRSVLKHLPSQALEILRVVNTHLNRVVNHLSGAYTFQSGIVGGLIGGVEKVPMLGPWTVFTQTGALLEVVHSLFGWVRSDPLTVAMQVASRIWMVWGIVEGRSETHSHPLLTSMFLAWSVTEVIRCGFYLTTLLGLKADGEGLGSLVVKGLTWLRYNTFYLLYPLGASSEAFLMSSTLPRLSGLPQSFAAQLRRKKGLLGGIGLPVDVRDRWMIRDLAVGGLWVGWWPALYVLFTHMIKLRAKVFGKGRKLNEKKVQ